MMPRRTLPGLPSRPVLQGVVQAWRGLAAIVRPRARGRACVAPDAGLSSQLDALHQQLRVAAIELEQMKRVAEHARARQAEFLAFVAHELRNPLAPIRTAVAVLADGRGGDPVAMRTLVERQVVQMSRMIDDLLDVSRAGTGKLRVVVARVHVADFVAQALANVAPALARRGQHLEVCGLEGAGDLDGDQTRLTQVLSNLLDNASKYSPGGQAIQLVVRPWAQSVELCVADQGIGMSIGALRTIFDPFAQQLRAVGFNPSGLGIGLAVVRDIVEAHGGRVTASSPGLGQGSRFVVSLPRRS